MPAWRQYFDAGERAVGERLESLVQTDAAAEAIIAAVTARSGVQQLAAHIVGQVESASTKALHLINLPSAGDVQALRRELLAMQVQIRELRHLLDETDSDRS